VPAAIEYREHLTSVDRHEIEADVALIAVALGSVLYLILRPVGSASLESISAAVTAILVASTIGAYLALSMWLPTRAHVGLLVGIGLLAAGVLVFAERWVEGVYVPGDTAVELPLVLSPLFLAALVNVVPRHGAREQVRPPTRYGRAILTTLSVATACLALAAVAAAETTDRLETDQGSVLIGILAIAVALRILVNQVRGSNASREARTPLTRRRSPSPRRTRPSPGSSGPTRPSASPRSACARSSRPRLTGSSNSTTRT